MSKMAKRGFLFFWSDISNFSPPPPEILDQPLNNKADITCFVYDYSPLFSKRGIIKLLMSVCLFVSQGV